MNPMALVNMDHKVRARLRRHIRVRKKVFGTSARPRLSIFRSHRHIYGQLIDDQLGRTLASASTMETAFRARPLKGGTAAAAHEVGKLLGERAVAAGARQAVFDRSGYRYHGRTKALAEGARAGGLQF